MNFLIIYLFMLNARISILRNFLISDTYDGAVVEYWLTVGYQLSIAAFFSYYCLARTKNYEPVQRGVHDSSIWEGQGLYSIKY